MQIAARQAKQPQLITLGPMTGLLHGQGIGSGNQTHLEYRFDWRGVLFAISQRKEPSRQLSNFYLKISGEPCLIEGAVEARKMVLEVVKVLGGVMLDEWPRRLDVCLDLPGTNLNDDLQPAFERGQFLTSAKKWNPFDGREGKTGFVVGSRALVRCIVYDKLVDSVMNHDPVYLQAMIDRRWNGTTPDHATRVEFQIGRDWLANKQGIRTVDEALFRMGDIAARFLSHERIPFFCLTSTVPDRKNKHQSRAEVLPLWDRIVTTMQTLAGERLQDLRPIRRGEITAKRGYQMIRGYLTTIGAQFEMNVESLEDGIEVLKELDRRNDGQAIEWASRWEVKARKAGTYGKVVSFGFGDNQAV